MKKSLTTTINSPIFGGLLKVNQGKGNIVWDCNNTKCVTYHGVGEVLTLETCDPDWTQCQEILQQHLTSNDPLVQSQTTIANCNGKNNIRQALEYASDFTIRPFNTNFCVKANSTMLVLEECAETSTILGRFNHTGQLKASDKTGLHSKATNRKGLTTKGGNLGLGQCHDRSQKQHFSFEYKNSYQLKTLLAATIRTWDTNQTSSLMANSKIPPMAKRELHNKIESTTAKADASMKKCTTLFPLTIVGPPRPPGPLGLPGPPAP